MKALQQSWKWSLPGIVLYVALSAGTNALGADTPVQPAASPKGKAKAPIAADLPKAIGKAPAPGGAPVVSEPVKLRAFRLDHDDPINVMSTAQLLLTAPGGPLAGMVGGQGGFGPSMPGMQPGAQLVGGFGGLAGIGGGGQLGALGGGGQLGALGGGGQLGAFGGGGQLGALGGGGLGGFSGGVVNLAQAFGMAGGPPSNVAGASAGATRFAVDARTRTFLARGPERELQIVTDLITVLNTAPGKPLPKVKSLHVFKLKHAMPEDVAAAVAQLGIHARLAPLQTEVGDAVGEDQPNQRGFLFALGTDEQIREVRQVIEAMDVRGMDPDAGAGPNAPDPNPAPAPAGRRAQPGGRRPGGRPAGGAPR